MEKCITKTADIMSTYRLSFLLCTWNCPVTVVSCGSLWCFLKLSSKLNHGLHNCIINSGWVGFTLCVCCILNHFVFQVMSFIQELGLDRVGPTVEGKRLVTVCKKYVYLFNLSNWLVSELKGTWLGWLTDCRASQLIDWWMDGWMGMDGWMDGDGWLDGINISGLNKFKDCDYHYY